MTQTMAGRSAGDKPINLAQLQAELATAGVMVDGLGSAAEVIFCYDANGAPSDFPEAQQATVDAAIAAHVAMRDKTDAEYATEFQDAATSATRKQEIRDITAGLLPREQVPMS